MLELAQHSGGAEQPGGEWHAPVGRQRLPGQRAHSPLRIHHCEMMKRGLGMLCAMGFTEEQSRSALEASNGDAEAACNMLLS